MESTKLWRPEGPCLQATQEVPTRPTPNPSCQERPQGHRPKPGTVTLRLLFLFYVGPLTPHNELG